jgi:hypothetical protein
MEFSLAIVEKLFGRERALELAKTMVFVWVQLLQLVCIRFLEYELFVNMRHGMFSPCVECTLVPFLATITWHLVMSLICNKVEANILCMKMFLLLSLLTSSLSAVNCELGVSVRAEDADILMRTWCRCLLFCMVNIVYYLVSFIWFWWAGWLPCYNNQ